MKVKILAQLKAKHAGVQNTILERISEELAKSVTKEDEIETAIDNVAGLVEVFSTTLQAEGDKRATEATKTAVTNYEKKYNLKDGKVLQTQTGGGEDGSDGKQAEQGNIGELIRNAISEAVKPLHEELSSLKADKSQKARLEMLTKEIDGLSEIQRTKIVKDFNRMAFADDTAFTEYLTETKTDIEAMKQEMVNSGLPNAPFRAVGNVNQKATEKTVEGVVDNIMP